MVPILPQTNDPKEIQKALLSLAQMIPDAGGGTVLSLNQKDYTETNTDQYGLIDVKCGTASRTIILRKAGSNLLRRRMYAKNDSGAGSIILSAQAGQKIYYPGASASQMYVGLQYQFVELEETASGYYITGGVVQPVAGEPSLGTPHHNSDANKSSALLVSTAVNTAGTWSAAVTMLGAPAGARAAWCGCQIYKSGSYPLLCVEAATGYTLSDITVGTNAYKYWQVPGVNSGVIAPMTIMARIPLDANKQFKWCSSVSSSNVIIGSAVDYDI
jgi:hypothetical protein